MKKKEIKEGTWNKAAYIETCIYCKEQMLAKKKTIKDLAVEAQVSESTINKFRRGETISRESFKLIDEACKKLLDGDSLLSYYHDRKHKISSRNRLVDTNMRVTIEGNECKIEPSALEKLLEDKGIDKRGFLAFSLYGANINILEVEKNFINIKKEQKADSYDAVTKIYINFVENNKLKRVCISSGVIKNVLKKLSEPVYIHIGNPEWLSAIYIEEELIDEWEELKEFVGEIHTVDAFNHYAERIYSVLTNLQGEGIFGFLCKHAKNEKIILEDEE